MHTPDQMLESKYVLSNSWSA